jgi:hypothetical protein
VRSYGAVVSWQRDYQVIVVFAISIKDEIGGVVVLFPKKIGNPALVLYLETPPKYCSAFDLIFSLADWATKE